jgi:hypothetical protein
MDLRSLRIKKEKGKNVSMYLPFTSTRYSFPRFFEGDLELGLRGRLGEFTML